MSKETVFTAMMLCVFAACSNVRTAEQQDTVIPVKVMEIISTQTASVKNYVGTVEESAAISLSFPLIGTVEEVLVQEGQWVRKGQLLAALNTTTAENMYQAMLAKERQAQDAYDRLTKVHQNGSLPDIKFVEVESGLEQAKSMTVISKKNLDDCKLYAPRDGIISQKNIEAGSSVNVAQAAFKLVEISRVFVKVPVSENEISGIVEGQTATVTVAALGNAVFAGRVAIKGVSANAVSHTYETKIEIANNAGTKNFSPLLPGMVCKVEIPNVSSKTENSQNTEIVVPNRCISVSSDGKRYVWLADGKIAKRRYVEIGDLTNSGIVIASGLSAGDKIITEGFLKICEGMKITVND
jgi:RND family efflux transporter MFP subunit